MKKINWGIIGGGQIAKIFAESINHSSHGKLISVASKNFENRNYFLKNFNSDLKIFDSYDDLLNDGNIDVVYIALINSLHKEYIIKCALKNKNILVEKPACLSAEEFKECRNFLSSSNIFFMEAMMYLHHPQFATILDFIYNSEIGEVLEVNSFFGNRINKNLFGINLKNIKKEHQRLFMNNIGGGAINDLGCYPVTLSMIIAGANNKIKFIPIKKLSAFGSVLSTGVDQNSYAEILFGNGIKAKIAVAINKKFKKPTLIKGSRGTIIIQKPWNPGSNYQLFLKRNGHTKVYSYQAKNINSYCYEVDHVNQLIIEKKKQADQIGMNWEMTENCLTILDEWKLKIKQNSSIAKIFLNKLLF
jgi:predicted dehydrogenase